MDHKGFHFRKRKAKLRDPPYLTPRQRLFSFLLAAWSLLLTSSVHAASQAMQPRLVELWKCRVLHLRQFHSTQKHKQTACPVISSDVRHLPAVMVLWLVAVSLAALLAKLHNITGYTVDKGIIMWTLWDQLFLCLIERFQGF